jgi:radical SAM superfamily enzyme YgiQ (UPF0313 family)
LKLTLIRPFYHSIWESLACGYIGSYLKEYYHEKPLELQFFDGFFDSDEVIIKGSVDSDFVGFSCTSPQMKHALRLAWKIKERNPKVQTVFGGHHPSSLQRETLAYPQVDMVVVGEGEVGLPMILRHPKDKTVYLPPPIENLDIIPFPDRKLIHQERTLALTEKNDGERIASMLSGRVCPFHCVFCTGDHDVFGNVVRKRSVENVLAEMQQLISQWNIDFVKFADAEINTTLEWLREFCREKIERGITVPWGGNIHAAIMDKPTLELMKKANCREIWIGCESGSPHILKEMGKAITIKQIKHVFTWAKEVGIRRRAYFMVGFPSETRSDFDLTLKLADEIDADTYGMTVLCPYPGTAVYSGKYVDVDWSLTDEYSNDFWITDSFSNEELKQLQSEFTKKFQDRLCIRQSKTVLAS